LGNIPTSPRRYTLRALSPRSRINLAAFAYDLAGFLFTGAVFLRLPELTGSTAGGSESQLNGLVQALASGGYAALALRMGVWSDKMARHQSCRLGTVLSGTAALFAAGATSPVALAGLVVAYWCSNSLFWPALQGGLGDLAPDAERSRWVATFNVSWCLGKAGGFLVAGILVQVFGAKTAIAVAGGLAIAAGFAVPQLPSSGPRPDGAPSSVSSGRFLVAAWLANFAAFGVGNILVSQLPVLGRSLGEPPTLIDGQLFVLFGAQVVAFFVLVHWHGWIDRKKPFLFAGVAMAVPPLLLPGIESAWLRMPLLFVAGLSFGFAYQASLTYSLRRGGARGKRAGIHEAVLGTGASLLPLLAGQAAFLSGGLKGAFFLAGGAAALLALLQILLVRRA